jgi:hypothetical protein
MEYPMRTSNKGSKKGMAKASGHPSTVAHDEHVGSSNSDGIRFKVHDHPDMSVVRGPEKR